MAVPKKKTSSSRSRMRRAHDALDSNAVSACKNCGEAVKPHNVCKACGFYAGKRVVDKAAR